ncbi:hypothetical protein PPERSA_08352 [Pseudocohnilembus persalinus]|uniref:Uncharacterized protein n=1 Tax=Pseudocohnilembus persalinus TaxID=266149 RepID=A0A0V0QPE2_PSEPJ|nr:hypothetical protein PPERSA_08352 [Pseudocohnilembus persalinus]|eukprot:KRX04137.1 hypothetical protein PPERSA_08352 [Pseudocohnilembus persalinus]
MRGIGDHLERQTKLKILQKRATEYNEKFDELEEKGNHPDKIREIIGQQQYQQRHKEDTNRVLPFDENKKVNNLSGIVDFGFENAHKTKSATKQMFQEAETTFSQSQKMKTMGQKIGTQDLLQKQREQDAKMKKKIYQDHLEEMYSGETFNKQPHKSNYQQNYEFNKNFQNECDNLDFSHRQMKNDLKWYSEAYQRYKATMRGGK